MWIVKWQLVSSRTTHIARISQVLFQFFIVTILAIEFDIPWNDEQVGTYGESFRAWGAEDFKNALAPILRAIPYNKIAIVVTISPFVFILLGLPFIRSTRVRTASAAN